jgi:hypothetical protein
MRKKPQDLPSVFLIGINTPGIEGERGTFIKIPLNTKQANEMTSVYLKTY